MPGPRPAPRFANRQRGYAVAVAHEPVHYVRVEPRLFGVLSPLSVLGIALLALLLAVGLLATGAWPYAIVLLLLALAALGFYAGAGPGRTLSLVERVALGSGQRVRGRLRRATMSAANRVSAEAEIMRLNGQLRRLHAVRDGLQYELGGAAYAENGERIETLRGQMAALDRRAVNLGLEIAAARERADERRRSLRLAARGTEVITPTRSDPS